jgi:hypothetical protein
VLASFCDALIIENLETSDSIGEEVSMSRNQVASLSKLSRLFFFLGVLVVPALACNFPFSGGQNTPATVNALSTSVRQTLVARTQFPTGPTVTTPATQPDVTSPPPTIVVPTLALPTPTTAPPTLAPPTSLPTVGGLKRPNGASIHASRRTTPPTIDGDLGDWSEFPYLINQPVYKPENWTGLNDQSATFALAWDGTSFYVGAQVVDDVHVQTQHGETLFRGDSLEMLLDTNLSGDYDSAKLSSDDFQLGLSPGSFAGDEPEAYLWFPTAKKGRPAGVVVAARHSGGEGYLIEASIPWSLFSITPAAGNTYGFVLSSSDNDAMEMAEQQSMISVILQRRLTNPTTWGTLVLD